MKRLQILNIGVDNSVSHYLSRTIRTVNLFSWLTVFGLLIGVSNILFLKDDYPISSQLCFLTFALVSIIFNYYKKYNVAAFIAILNINCAVFFINEYYDVTTGTYLFYFPLIICIALLYTPGESIRNIAYYYIMSAVFLLTSFFIDFEGLRNKNISAENNQILFMYDIVFCIGITALLVFMLIRLINSQNKELIELLKSEKKALNEKEILLAEVHHRVKNNLAVISGLLNLQINNTLNSEAKAVLEENRNRVLSISKVHDKLYNKTDLSKIEFSEYASELIDNICSSNNKNCNVKITKHLLPCELAVSKAIPAGLVLNEMMTNCLKHAFTEHSNPEIELTIWQNENKTYISIKDNGKGFDPNNKLIDSSLGISLMKSLAEQIDGTIEFSNENGTKVTLCFVH